jgi:hypothetical protein
MDKNRITLRHLGHSKDRIRHLLATGVTVLVSARHCICCTRFRHPRRCSLGRKYATLRRAAYIGINFRGRDMAGVEKKDLPVDQPFKLLSDLHI